MRRGKRDRWEYDQSPQGDGLVTVSTLASTTNYDTVEALAARKVAGPSKAILRDLIAMGWLNATPAPWFSKAPPAKLNP